MPVEARVRRQLVLSAEELHQALSRFRTGESWQVYLALPAVWLDQANSMSGSQASPSAADLAELEQTLERFERVTQEPDYRVIAELAEFEATYRRLGEYLDLPRDRSSPRGEDFSPVEELPVPLPQGLPEPSSGPPEQDRAAGGR